LSFNIFTPVAIHTVAAEVKLKTIHSISQTYQILKISLRNRNLNKY